MMDLRRVAVFIPALNEEASLPLVLRDLPAVGRVIVVDNGSTDATATLAAGSGATGARQAPPGYGAACLRGLAGAGAPARARQPSPEGGDFPEPGLYDEAPILPALG